MATLRDVYEELTQARQFHRDETRELRDVHFRVDQEEDEEGSPRAQIKMLFDGVPYDLNKVSHGQFSARLGIPSTYLPKCPPWLVQKNVGFWKQQAGDRKFLFRLNDSTRTVRAVLSERYTDVPHEQILEVIMQNSKLREYEVRSFALTDEQMEIRLTAPDSFDIDPVVPNDQYFPGVLIRNSDVGLHTFNISSFLYVLVCTNGLVSMRQLSMTKRRHIGDIDIPSMVNKGVERSVDSPFPAAAISLIPYKAAQLPILAGDDEDDKVLTRLLSGSGLTKKFIGRVRNRLHYDVRSGWNVLQAMTKESQALGADMRQGVDRAAGDLAVDFLRSYDPAVARKVLFHAAA